MKTIAHQLVGNPSGDLALVLLLSMTSQGMGYPLGQQSWLWLLPISCTFPQFSNNQGMPVLSPLLPGQIQNTVP